MPGRHEKWLNALESVLTAVAAVLLVLMSVFVTYQAFARYVLKTGIFWIEELSVVALMWVGLLGAAGGVWTESHVGLEFVTARLPKTVQLWVRCFGDLVVALFACFLLVQGSKLASVLMSATLATLSVPLGYTYLALPIAGGLMAVFALARAAGRILAHRAQRRGADA